MLAHSTGQKVLLLGFHTPAFLSVIRSLGRAGIEVHVAWHKPDSLALCSRYVHRVHSIPAYSKQDSSWKEALIDLMQREKFDLVIPCHDETVFPLQKHKTELEAYGRIYTISKESFAVLFDKIKTNELARKLGINVPKETVLYREDREGAWEKIKAAQLDFPIVLKPHSSYNDNDKPARIHVQIARRAEDLAPMLNSLLAYGPVIAQEFFIGKGVGVNFLLEEGKPLLVFQQELVHEPLQGGSGTYRKSTAVCPELERAALKIFSHLKYTGVAMAEFKVNPATGSWVLIEINARFWGSLPLALAAGANFPLALFELLTTGRTSVKNSYRRGIYARNLTADLSWQLKNLTADHKDPTLLTVPVSKVLLTGFKNILTGKERIDTLALDDLKPFRREVFLLGQMAWEKIRANIEQRYMCLPIFLHLQRRKLAQKLPGAKSILFVCHGNLCRSVFAEHLLKKNAPSAEVRSAGFLPEEGRKPPAEALSLALEYGIDLSGHCSKRINEEMVSSSDLIFVFDYDNYKKFRQEYRQARKKVFLIGALLEEKQPFISDPWGKDMYYFRTIYKSINAAVGQITNMLKTARPI